MAHIFNEGGLCVLLRRDSPYVLAPIVEGDEMLAGFNVLIRMFDGFNLILLLMKLGLVVGVCGAFSGIAGNWLCFAGLLNWTYVCDDLSSGVLSISPVGRGENFHFIG